MRVTRRLGITKKRSFIRIAGVSPDIDIVPFNHNISTLERAVKERVFCVKNVKSKTNLDVEFTSPPAPVAGAFGRLGETYRELKTYLPSTAPITARQFVDSYRGRKKMVYENALTELELGNSTPEEDAKVKVFIKYEKTDRTSKADPVPRVISPRNPKFNIRLGKYLKPLEERVFKSLGRLFKHRTVMKGMDVFQVAGCLREKWDMFKHPVAVGLDASRFDQHVSVDALNFEHGVYLDCFKRKSHKEKLERLLKLQLENHCTGHAEDGSLRYKTTGTRMSGDMNTSLGNCVLMVSMIHAYLKHKNVVGQLANNGDDCVVFMEKQDLEKFSDGLFDWFWDMGFNMAIEKPVTEFEEVEFCQCKPVWDGSKWRMCRNPWTALAKDSVLLKNNVSQDYFRLWMNAVGEGGLSIAGGMPIFQSFYQMFIRSGITSYRKSKGDKIVTISNDEIMPWFMREVGLKGSAKAAEVTAESRASFWAAYGVTPDEQVCLEKYYDGITIGCFGEEWFPRSIFPDCI